MKTGLKTLAASIAATFIITSASGTCSAAALSPEKSLAGITLSFDKYYDNKISADNEETATTDKGETKTVTVVAKKKKGKVSIVCDKLGIADVNSYLNVRKKPDQSSKIVGKMTKNAGCRVYSIKKGWAKIVSGKVKGYAKAEYILTDKKAEERAKQVASLHITVDTETLNVRSLPSTQADIVDKISMDEDYAVGKKNITKKWLKKYVKKNCKKKELKGIDLDKMYKGASNWVMLNIDNDHMFVSKDFVKFTYNLDHAVKFNSNTSLENDNSSSKEQEKSGTSSSTSSSSSTASAMVNYAMQFLGNPYVWGGTSLTHGADCSGFVMKIYEHFGYSIPRTSSSQASATKTVSSSDLKLGDLFFYGSGSTVSHVAMYIGNGQVIHASNAKDGIKISSAYYRQPIKIGRVM